MTFTISNEITTKLSNEYIETSDGSSKLIYLFLSDSNKPMTCQRNN